MKVPFKKNYDGRGVAIILSWFDFFTDICWLRLDFETFTNQGPAATDEATGGNGICVDTFTVTSSTSSQDYPVICGDNTGQHSESNYTATVLEMAPLLNKHYWNVVILS